VLRHPQVQHPDLGWTWSWGVSTLHGVGRRHLWRPPKEEDLWFIVTKYIYIRRNVFNKSIIYKKGNYWG
jgi:hypothetical protein